MANVPYDCGVAFIDDPILHRDTFSASAAYLGSGDPGGPHSATSRLRCRGGRVPCGMGDASRLRP